VRGSPWGKSTPINWPRRWRETGLLEAGRQGKPRRSKLDPHEAFIPDLLARRKDIALDEIAEALATERGVVACPASVLYFSSRRGLTLKKDGPCQRTAAPRHPHAAPGLVRRPALPPQGVSYTGIGKPPPSPTVCG